MAAAAESGPGGQRIAVGVEEIGSGGPGIGFPRDRRRVQKNQILPGELQKVGALQKLSVHVAAIHAPRGVSVVGEDRQAVGFRIGGGLDPVGGPGPGDVFADGGGRLRSGIGHGERQRGIRNLQEITLISQRRRTADGERNAAVGGPAHRDRAGETGSAVGQTVKSGLLRRGDGDRKREVREPGKVVDERKLSGLPPGQIQLDRMPRSVQKTGGRAVRRAKLARDRRVARQNGRFVVADDEQETSLGNDGVGKFSARGVEPPAGEDGQSRSGSAGRHLEKCAGAHHRGGKKPAAVDVVDTVAGKGKIRDRAAA